MLSTTSTLQYYFDHFLSFVKDEKENEKEEEEKENKRKKGERQQEEKNGGRGWKEKNGTTTYLRALVAIFMK